MFWLFVLAGFLAFSFIVLRGENLAYLDQPPPPPEPASMSEEEQAVLNRLRDMAAQDLGFGRQRIYKVRQLLDEVGSEREVDCEFRSVHTNQVRGEWVLAPNSDPTKRMLYIHGGAFFAGSPLSHRPLTDRLAKLTGMAVFSLDYRLMPEHRRIHGIEDCRSAYRWILENGPEESGAAEFIVVAGDSAGGNLTLSTIAWVRDEGLRQADAAIALSPATDGVLDAPSIRDNIPTDPMLGPAFGYLAKVPNVLLLWFNWFTARMMPSDPRVSPLRGDLSNLPPILIQASTTEMLLDDARRYVAKAQAAESPVVLQTWPNMIHVWQMFSEMPQAEEALQNIAEFLDAVQVR